VRYLESKFKFKKFKWAAIIAFLLIASSLIISNRIFDKPHHIHLTWKRNNTSHTITVTWQTYRPYSGDMVLYDTVQHGGNPKRYRYSAQGIHHTYPGASGYIHDVELTGLIPDTVYYFICGGDNGGWSGEMAFKTQPVDSSNVRFVVGGDCRSNPSERDRISKTMSSFNPDFVVFTGDMVEDGENQGEWDDFFNHMENFWIRNDGLTIPTIPVLGNHEKNSTKYYEQFSLPGNEQWYSLDFGPDIHIIVLNSEADAEGLLAQKEWLEGDLASHNSSLWKFVFFHRNVFTSDHSSWEEAFKYFVPLFDKYNVDIVFNGHSHNYMRTKPINWTALSNSQEFFNGTIYVVSGG